MGKYNVGLVIFALATITSLSVSSNFVQSLKNIMFAKKRKLRGPKDDKTKPLGDLISVGSDRFKSNFWKFLASSELENEECDLKVINNSNEIYLICWVRPDGTLTNYFPINDGSIRDGSVSNKHAEGTFTNHVFVVIKQSAVLPKHIADINPTSFIFSYRPLKANIVHIIKIKKSINDTLEIDLDYEEFDKTAIIDTSNKCYDKVIVKGFTIYYEPILLTSMPELFATLEEDLDMVCKLLPPDACQKLKKDTYFYINDSLTYGTQNRPVVGREMCFHPSAGWLKSNGMSPKKAGCIEMYQAKHYLKGRYLWGIGGLLLHELSHAYHCKHCPDGYDCMSVMDAYNKAMQEGLYERVAVKGKQGETAPEGRVKAYACTNCMEFFAELSVAYLFQPNYFDSINLEDPETILAHEKNDISSDEGEYTSSSDDDDDDDDDDDNSSKSDASENKKETKIKNKNMSTVQNTIITTSSTIESKNTNNSNTTQNNLQYYHKNHYNKWYPFNAVQLQRHDPYSYAVLDSLWNPK